MHDYGPVFVAVSDGDGTDNPDDLGEWFLPLR